MPNPERPAPDFVWTLDPGNEPPQAIRWDTVQLRYFDETATAVNIPDEGPTRHPADPPPATAAPGPQVAGRRRRGTDDQAPPRLTYPRARPATPPPTPTIQNVRITQLRQEAQNIRITAEFLMNDGTPLRFEFPYYVDIGRTMIPFGEALTAHLIETIRAMMNLPEPPRREIPNATVGERLFNMVGFLMDKHETSPTVQQEWNTLSAEYERVMGGMRF